MSASFNGMDRSGNNRVPISMVKQLETTAALMSHCRLMAALWPLAHLKMMEVAQVRVLFVSTNGPTAHGHSLVEILMEKAQVIKVVIQLLSLPMA